MNAHRNQRNNRHTQDHLTREATTPRRRVASSRAARTVQLREALHHHGVVRHFSAAAVHDARSARAYRRRAVFPHSAARRAHRAQRVIRDHCEVAGAFHLDHHAVRLLLEVVARVGRFLERHGWHAPFSCGSSTNAAQSLITPFARALGRASSANRAVSRHDRHSPVALLLPYRAKSPSAAHANGCRQHGQRHANVRNSTTSNRRPVIGCREGETRSP